MKYKCYHSCVKICHALGIEKQLLPSTFLCNISPSTAHYWKSQNPDSFLGGEYSNLVGADVKDLQLILDRRYRHTKRVFMAMIRLQAMPPIRSDPALKSADSVDSVLQNVNERLILISFSYFIKRISFSKSYSLKILLEKVVFYFN